MSVTDKALAHLVQSPRSWTHWRDAIVPGVFIQFKGWRTRPEDQIRAPLFRVFAVGEDFKPRHLEVPAAPGSLVEDFQGFTDQLAVDGPRGSRIGPMAYLIHPDIDSQILSLDQADVVNLATATRETLAQFASCPFYTETLP